MLRALPIASKNIYIKSMLFIHLQILISLKNVIRSTVSKRNSKFICDSALISRFSNNENAAMNIKQHRRKYAKNVAHRLQVKSSGIVQA